MLTNNLIYRCVGRQVKFSKKIKTLFRHELTQINADLSRISYVVRGMSPVDSRCHVECNRDIWILTKLAFRSKSDLFDKLRAGLTTANKVWCQEINRWLSRMAVR